MLGRRLITTLVILVLLAGCMPNQARDGDGRNPQSTQQSSSESSNPDTTHSSQGGGGGFNIPGNVDPRALLVVVAIIVVVGAVIIVGHLASESIDYVKQHSTPSLTGKVQDGVYHAQGNLFSVAVPGAYPAHGNTGVEVHEIVDQGQKQVVFLPTVGGDPLYGVSVQPQLSASDAAMSLDDFASKLYPPPASNDPAVHGKPLKPVLDEKLSLDGKPALFREYTQEANGIKQPVYYLLYFIKTDGRSALLSITWPKACPKCASGPEVDIRAMDPTLQTFVDSFRFSAVGSSR